MKLTDRDIAVRLLALEDSNNEADLDLWLPHFESKFDETATMKHDGDCTGKTWTCCRCLHDDTMARVPLVRRLFGIEAPE